jgi:serine/threonine protein kinase
LAGKFTLERRLGSGGIGVVYLGTDTRLDRRVALKTLPRLRTGAAAAMHAEARAMAAVEHASVAVLYELQVWRETPVLVVEYLAGGTLAARLVDGALPAREAVTLATTLADALSALHGRGWLHGDIKPSNIGIGRDGAPKLLDFGLTRLVAHARPSAPEAAGDACGTPGCDTCEPLAGTPLYLSPEALDGRPGGAHGDVWALSLVLFEMVAGAHPFRASSLDAVLHRVRRATPVDVHQWAPGVSTPLADLLRRALHPRLSQRIATASELAAALRVVAAQL